MVVFWAKLVKIVQMWLFSGKSYCNREKVVVFGRFGCIPAKWLCSGKVVVFGQKVVVFGQKVVVFGQKVVVFRRIG